MFISKNKYLLYRIAMFFTIIFFGLQVRNLWSFLPSILNLVLGDILWAMMVFTGFSIVFRFKNTRTISFYSLIFSFLIEISQLYHAPWIDQLRQTRLGGLILGFGFLWSDLLAYSIGIILAYAIFQIKALHPTHETTN